MSPCQSPHPLSVLYVSCLVGTRLFILLPVVLPFFSLVCPSSSLSSVCFLLLSSSAARTSQVVSPLSCWKYGLTLAGKNVRYIVHKSGFSWIQTLPLRYTYLHYVSHTKYVPCSFKQLVKLQMCFLWICTWLVPLATIFFSNTGVRVYNDYGFYYLCVPFPKLLNWR